MIVYAACSDAICELFRGQIYGREGFSPVVLEALDHASVIADHSVHGVPLIAAHVLHASKSQAHPPGAGQDCLVLAWAQDLLVGTRRDKQVNPEPSWLLVGVFYSGLSLSTPLPNSR